METKLFDLLEEGIRSIDENNFFTDALLKGTLQDENIMREVNQVISGAIEQTEDEAKRLYLIAQHIEDEIIGKGWIHDKINDINDKNIINFLDEIKYYQIDAFEIAKSLYNDYCCKIKLSA